MAVYEAFSCSLRLKYKANLCSKTTLFYVLTKVVTFILPLIIIYSEGFWRSVNYYAEQPDISFKHKMFLILETDNLNDILFWSTYKKLNKLIPLNMQRVVPIIEHREEDYNRDGKYDELLMKIEVPLKKEKILSVKLLLIFDYKLHLNMKFQMECASYIYHSSPLPGSSLYFIGDLHLHQRETLNYKGTDTKYNTSVIDEMHRAASFLKLENIFLQYAKRNVSTSIINQYPVWKSGLTDDNSFEINLDIKYSEQTFLYKVQLWELVKRFIVQYIAFFAILSYVFYKIKLYVFRKQLVPTIVVSPIKRD